MNPHADYDENAPDIPGERAPGRRHHDDIVITVTRHIPGHGVYRAVDSRFIPITDLADAADATIADQVWELVRLTDPDPDGTLPYIPGVT